MKKLRLILLLSVSSALAKSGEGPKRKQSKHMGNPIGGEKGFTAHHKGDWLVTQACDDEGKYVICIYFKIFGHINDEDAASLVKENL